MSAYCVFLVREISDPAKLGEYRQSVVANVTKYGGTYRVLGGTCDALEAAAKPITGVIIEFPTLAAARKWYDSEDYAPLKKLRLDATRCEAFFMEGLPDQAAAR